MDRHQHNGSSTPSGSVNLLDPKGNLMNFSQVLALIATLFITFETDQAVLESGGTASTPSIQVGTIGGKPLYVSANLSTTKTPA